MVSLLHQVVNLCCLVCCFCCWPPNFCGTLSSVKGGRRKKSRPAQPSTRRYYQEMKDGSHCRLTEQLVCVAPAGVLPAHKAARLHYGNRYGVSAWGISPFISPPKEYREPSITLSVALKSQKVATLVLDGMGMFNALVNWLGRAEQSLNCSPPSLPVVRCKSLA